MRRMSLSNVFIEAGFEGDDAASEVHTSLMNTLRVRLLPLETNQDVGSHSLRPGRLTALAVLFFAGSSYLVAGTFAAGASPSCCIMPS